MMRFADIIDDYWVWVDRSLPLLSTWSQNGFKVSSFNNSITLSHYWL